MMQDWRRIQDSMGRVWSSSRDGTVGETVVERGEDGREEQRRRGDEEGEEEKRKKDEQSFLPGGNKQATLSQSSAPARLRPLFGLVAFPFWRPVFTG